MDFHTDLEAATPAMSYDNLSLYKIEDSGYHTSFTPGSIECAEISNENLEPSTFQKRIRRPRQIQLEHYDISPEISFRLGLKHNHSKSASVSTCNDNFTESPVIRRGLKRTHSEDTENNETTFSSVPTPTSAIAGGIQRLKVNDKYITSFSISPVNTEQIDSSSGFYNLDGYAQALSFPTTPVKKICRSSCKLSPRSPLSNICYPPRKSAKKLSFAIHSLSCESQGLQPIIRRRPQSKVVRTIEFKPHQKVDIVKMLYQKVCCMPVIMNIFSYLSSEDIYNFSLVSPIWLKICEDIRAAKTKKEEYREYLQKTKENRGNRVSDIALKNNDSISMRSLKEIHNVLNAHATSKSIVNTQSSSPPGTPRTIKFKRFTKSASLDCRIQLACVRCCQPAKVTEESSGEEWAECTSETCAFQFCRFCKCDRHPSKKCFQFDLDGPSPSKRKKKDNDTCIVGTKKSRKNLRRLL